MPTSQAQRSMLAELPGVMSVKLRRGVLSLYIVDQAALVAAVARVHGVGLGLLGAAAIGHVSS